MNNPPAEHPDSETAYLAITGRVYASPGLGRRIRHMQWQTTVVYNAAVDSKRDFTANVEHAITYSAARSAGGKLPDRLPEGKAFRSLNQAADLVKMLQPLTARHDDLQGPPVSVYVNAIQQAERARARLVKDIKATPEGQKNPRLKFRSMRDAASLTTDNWRLYERRGPDWKRPEGPSIRSDSPRATIGKTKVKLEIQGLGRFNVNLSRPIPDDGTIKQIVVSMEADRGRIQIRLIVERSVRSMRAEIEARAWRAHEILRDMPDGLTSQQAIAWARDHGLKVRGDDLGIDAPSMNDQGVATPRVAMTRTERERVRDAQRALSRLDELALQALPAAEQAAVRAGEAKAPKRSKNARRIQHQIARARRKVSNRSRTAACKDARDFVTGVEIVATDSPQMATELMRKGGPAERRVKANKANQDAVRPKAPSDWMLSPAQQRTMRHNMATTTGAFRMRRIGHLAQKLGIIHLMPGHAGTSSECPSCDAFKDNALSRRRHVCACGVDMPRDHASAQVTLGRGLKQLRESSDPGGVRAAQWAKQDQAISRRQKRVDGVREAARRRREKAGSSESAMHGPGHGNRHEHQFETSRISK